MTKQVWITLRATIDRPGLAQEKTEERVPGELSEDGDGGWLISYDEPEHSGLVGNRTTLRLAPGQAELHREGTSRCTLHFREGERCPSYYNMPLGRLTGIVEAHRVRVRMDSRGGIAELRYRMELEGLGESEHCLRVLVREET